MLKPMADIARPRETASGTAVHQLSVAKTSSRYDVMAQVKTTAVFTYICQQSRGLRPVLRKYWSTRALTVLKKASEPSNFNRLFTAGAAAADMRNALLGQDRTYLKDQGVVPPRRSAP